MVRERVTPVKELPCVYYHFAAGFCSGAATEGSVLPVLNVRGTLEPAGLTRTYPCISWCSAEQKSVQYIG